MPNKRQYRQSASAQYFSCASTAAQRASLLPLTLNDVAGKNGLPYRAIARGIHPDKEIPPYITSGLTAEGLSIRGWQPKRFGEEDAVRAERVITLGCTLPTSKGLPAGKLQDWNVQSPSENYQNASRAIAERVVVLLKELAGQQILK